MISTNSLDLALVNPKTRESRERVSRVKATARIIDRIFYSTGEPCRNGHLARRYLSNTKCVQCEAEKARRWSLRNHDTLHARKMLWSARRRATDLGLPFGITIEDIIIPETCPVDGLPIILTNPNRRGPHPRSPSLDRFIPAQGYVKGNVQVISQYWNLRKGDMTIDGVRQLLAFMEKHA